MLARKKEIEFYNTEPEGVATDDARILVVDDLRSSRMLIGAVLASAGFTNIEYAADGVEAMEKVQSWNPDLLVLDLVMPNKDGYAVCREVRQELKNDIPILVQSGIQDSDDRVRVFDEGATDLVTKPINAAELVSRVRVHVEHRRLIASLQTYQRRMEEELRAAEAMQVSLIRSTEEIARIGGPRGVRLATHYQSSNQLGGDLWQIFPIDEHRFGLFVVDLSGHGVTAAINAFRLHMLVETVENGREHPGRWLEAINAHLYEILPVQHFATAFYGVFDNRDRSLEYASAAAPTPIILKADGGYEGLDASGLLLGCTDDVEYEVRRVLLDEGDRILLYSDALVEDFDDVENSLSVDDVANLSRALLTEFEFEQFPARIIKHVFGDHTTSLRDDLTLVLMEVV